MSETNENDYDEYVRTKKNIAKSNVVIIFAVVAICALIMKYDTFLFNLLPESKKWPKLLYEIVIVFGIAIILTQSGFHYIKKLWLNKEIDKSKLEIFLSIVLFVSMMIYSGIFAIDVSFPIMSAMNDTIQVLVRIGFFIAILMGILFLFLFGEWIGAHEVIDYTLTPLEKRYEKEKEDEKEKKEILLEGLPAATVVAPTEPIFLVERTPDGSNRSIDKVIDLTFIASGDPYPKLEDYDWFVESSNPFVDAHISTYDSAIKVSLSVSSQFFDYISDPFGAGEDEDDIGEAVVTLTGMHQNRGGPGICANITVIYDM